MTKLDALNKDCGIPCHWLNNEPSGYWHIREGIWLNPESEHIVRVAYIHLTLQDLPEAYSDFNKAQGRFIKKYAKPLISWTNQRITRIKKHGERAIYKNPPDLDGDALNLIFQPWVDKWGLGSHKLLSFAIAVSTLDSVVRRLFIQHGKQLVINGRPSPEIFEFARTLNLDKGITDYWEILLGKEYDQVKKVVRKSARRTVRNHGFFTREENILSRNAQCWVMTRVLGFFEDDVLRLVSFHTKDGSSYEGSNFSTKVLHPFDIALEYKPKPGRTFSIRLKRPDIKRKLDAYIKNISD